MLLPEADSVSGAGNLSVQVSGGLGAGQAQAPAVSPAISGGLSGPPVGETPPPAQSSEQWAGAELLPDTPCSLCTRLPSLTCNDYE